MAAGGSFPLAAKDRRRHPSGMPQPHQKTGSGRISPCCRHDKTGPHFAALPISACQISKWSCACFRLRFLCVDTTITQPRIRCQGGPSPVPPAQKRAPVTGARFCRMLCPRMGFSVDILNLLVHQPGVYLGGGDIRMAQHLLNGAQVRPVFQQMGGEGVAQGMGG